MKELMPLEILSNIEGVTSSKSIDQLFETIRKVETEKTNDDFIDRLSINVITTDDLREDIVVPASDVEKRLIIANFPNEKNNYLIVPKVIEE